MTGRLRSGTSGFAYPGWAPRFYPSGLRGLDLLHHYAGRLGACELNSTFYAQPTAERISAWRDATPETFRFSVKAQRGGSLRAILNDPAESLAWMTPPYRSFGQRLGAVLFRVPDRLARDDARLIALVRAWPADLPLVVEFENPSWQDDATFAALRGTGTTLCVTERPEDAEPPVIRRTGPFLYLRLRRHDYDAPSLAAWADRVEPFLRAGDDVYVFFRHDEVGRGAELALEFDRVVAERLT